MARKFENLTKEMEFVMAIRPFIGEGSSEKIDNLLEMMNAMEAMKKAGKGLMAYAPRPEMPINNFQVAAAEQIYDLSDLDDSIHPDGVYDLDQTCVASQNAQTGFFDFLPLMAAFMFKPN